LLLDQWSKTKNRFPRATLDIYYGLANISPTIKEELQAKLSDLKELYTNNLKNRELGKAADRTRWSCGPSQWGERESEANRPERRPGFEPGFAGAEAAQLE